MLGTVGAGVEAGVDVRDVVDEGVDVVEAVVDEDTDDGPGVRSLPLEEVETADGEVGEGSPVKELRFGCSCCRLRRLSPVPSCVKRKQSLVSEQK